MNKLSFLLLCFFSFASLNCSVQFTWELLKNPTQVGAWFQSSSSVAEELVRSLELLPGQRRILELGAGMGAVTHAIVKSMHDGDVLDVVEINEVYAAHLQEEFAHMDSVKVHCADALMYATDDPYDVIICTLPLTMFSRLELDTLFKRLVTLVAPNGYISFIEYMLIERIRRMFHSEVSRKLFDEKLRAIAVFKDNYLLVTKRVYGNLPPLYVHHLCVEKN